MLISSDKCANVLYLIPDQYCTMGDRASTNGVDVRTIALIYSKLLDDAFSTPLAVTFVSHSFLSSEWLG